MSHLKLWVLMVLAAATVGAWAQSADQFEPYSVHALSQEARTVAIGDLNGDGLDDVAVAAWPSALFVLYQQQDGTLGPANSLYAPNMPAGLAVGDINGDGRNDLAVGGTAGQVLLYYQQQNGSLGLPVAYNAYGTVSGLAIGDVNSDGLADVVVSTPDYSVLFVLVQSAGGGFGLPAFYSLSGVNGRCVTTLDFNSDGRKDVALLFDDKVCYLIQDELGVLGAAQYLPAVWAHSLAAGDVTGDGRSDLVFTVAENQPYGGIGVYAQNATGDFEPLEVYPAYDFAQPLAIADIDGDGRNDVLAAHSGYETLTLTRQAADGTLQAWENYPLPYCNSYRPGGLAVGDLNSDGQPDVAVADWWNGLVVLLHTAGGDVTAPVCSASLSGTVGLEGWYTSAVEFTVTAQDEPGGSGVKSIFYAVGDGAWQLYVGPVTIAANGVTRFGCYAEDAAGNKSEPAWVDAAIDTQAPSLSLTPSVDTLWPPSGQTVEILVDAAGSDQTSGLASLHLKVLDEYGLVEPEMDVTANPVAVSLVASRDGTDKDGRVYTLVLTGADVAGNSASVSSIVTVPAGNPKKPEKPDKPPKPKKLK